jgi:hypothetical protein
MGGTDRQAAVATAVACRGWRAPRRCRGTLQRPTPTRARPPAADYMRAWTSRRRRGAGRGRSTTGPADRLGLTVTRPRPHPSLGNIALYFADSGQDSGLLHCSAHPVLLRSGRAPPILCLLLAAAEDEKSSELPQDKVQARAQTKEYQSF